MASKVWSYGVLVIFAFISGSMSETGGEGSSAQVGAVIALVVWSVSVILVSIGYSEGKQKH